MISVAEARYVTGYRIWIRFNTGETGEVDLEDMVRKYPVASSLVDQSEFANFFLDEWPTLAWSCGFDVSPETLYGRATKKRPSWLDGEMDKAA